MPHIERSSKAESLKPLSTISPKHAHLVRNTGSDECLGLRSGLIQTRRAAIALLWLLAAGNAGALLILVLGLVTTSTADLGGGELLLTGFAIYSADVIVFGLMFWELEAGGPLARSREERGGPADFRFPQDDSPAPWHPRVWDYLYVSVTNAIAFSPTDTMPLSLRAKAVMGFESLLSAVTVLLVAARAVNVLGS